MTAADHANTVREALERLPLTSRPNDETYAAFAALDALVAQAEAAEARVASLEMSLNTEYIRRNLAEAERDDYRTANEAVRVCSAHTREVVTGDGCLVCDMEDANSRAETAEADNTQLAKALVSDSFLRDRLEAERDRLAGAAQAACDTGRPAEIRKLAQVLAALARTETTPQRHGRDCRCTPCRAEDWDAIDAGLAHTENTP